MDQMHGTPITRSGGYLIRVGWRAVGYSVDHSLEARFQQIRLLLLALALLVGVGAALLVQHLFMTIIVPLGSEHLPMLKNYVGIWLLLINLTTWICGSVIYMEIMATIGERMVGDQPAFDKGLGLVDQLREEAWTSKRVIILTGLIIAALLAAPFEIGAGVRPIVLIVLGYHFAAGLYFRYVRPVG